MHARMCALLAMVAGVLPYMQGWGPLEETKMKMIKGQKTDLFSPQGSAFWKQRIAKEDHASGGSLCGLLSRHGDRVPASTAQPSDRLYPLGGTRGRYIYAGGHQDLAAYSSVDPPRAAARARAARYRYPAEVASGEV